MHQILHRGIKIQLNTSNLVENVKEINYRFHTLKIIESKSVPVNLLISLYKPFELDGFVNIHTRHLL